MSPFLYSSGALSTHKLFHYHYIKAHKKRIGIVNAMQCNGPKYYIVIQHNIVAFITCTWLDGVGIWSGWA